MSHLRVATCAALLTAGLLPSASAQTEVTQIGRHLYLTEATAGGFPNYRNNVVLTGDDGLLVVDTSDPGTYESFRADLDQISTDPVAVLIDTHWHPDHAGLNADLVINEGTSRIIAHAGVGPLLANGLFMEDLGVAAPPMPEEAQPTESFEHLKVMRYNHEPIILVHVPAAHTRTDVLVYFPRENVVYAGDIYFGGYFPFIDRSSGGGIDGMIRAGHYLLATTNRHTKIIPTHGAPGTRADLQAYVQMLELARQRVQALVDQGLTEKDVIAAAPLADLQGDWGWFFIPSDFFTTLVYRSLTQPAH